MIYEISYFFAALAQIFARKTIITLILVILAFTINLVVFKILKLILPQKLGNLLNNINSVIFSIIMTFYFLFIIGDIFEIYFYIYSDGYFSIFQKIIILILVQIIYGFILKILLLISSLLMLGFEYVNKFKLESVSEKILFIPLGIFGILASSSIMLLFASLLVYFIKSLFI